MSDRTRRAGTQLSVVPCNAASLQASSGAMRLLRWPNAIAAAYLIRADPSTHGVASHGDSAALAHNAASALRNVEAALLHIGNKAGANELESFATQVEADPAPGGGVVIESDAQERMEMLAGLRRRLDRLQEQYDTKVEASNSFDEEQTQRMEAVRTGIEAAEERLEQLFPKGNRLDIDFEITPYPGAVKQFGTEEVGHNLTDANVEESDSMIDSIEHAQAAEWKRAVYRALTHLRVATIAAYDGIARSHLKNVEQYAAEHHWRSEQPVRHLAEEEADVERWAFPAKAAKVFHLTDESINDQLRVGAWFVSFGSTPELAHELDQLSFELHGHRINVATIELTPKVAEEFNVTSTQMRLYHSAAFTVYPGPAYAEDMRAWIFENMAKGTVARFTHTPSTPWVWLVPVLAIMVGTILLSILLLRCRLRRPVHPVPPLASDGTKEAIAQLEKSYARVQQQLAQLQKTQEATLCTTIASCCRRPRAL